MILVDTSVVIDWSRGKDAKLRLLLPSLPVGVCGVSQAEILHGSRDPAHRQRLLTDLGAFQFIPMPDALWINVGDNLAALRRKGVTVPLADAVVATLGIENDVEVWARDPHFPAMQKVLPILKLFPEPP
ncbi:MAG TPA: PIN domain-containing protein [Gemmataceae bacterium]|jgi:predicted nucleic acid-binding protein|nr:PIN domain-containing protein [Gemmataceae bacterium]